MLAAAGCSDTPSQVLLVDDEEKHIRIAESLGIKGLLFCSGETTALLSKLRQFGIQL
jgi:FMN phosphatase YigB (HAD superfamily)